MIAATDDAIRLIDAPSAIVMPLRHFRHAMRHYANAP